MGKSLKTIITNFNTNRQFIDFYNKFNGYKSERREIIKNEYVDGTYSFSVKFVYKLVWNKMFHKGESEVVNIIDPIVFMSEKEAELYIEEAITPVIKYVDNNHRWYLNIKDGEALKNLTGCLPECLYNDKTRTAVFGLYGTRKFDRGSFSDFLYAVRNEYHYEFKRSTTLKSFDIQAIANVETREKIEELKNERNVVIVNEIQRTEDYLKFLKSMIK